MILKNLAIIQIFFYQKLDLWIEHFAIDSNGNSPFPGYVEQSNEKKRNSLRVQLKS